MVVSVSTEPDTRTSYFGIGIGIGIGIGKENPSQFVQAYAPDEFAESLRQITDGEMDVEPTREVGLQDVQQAFGDLASRGRNWRILLLRPAEWSHVATDSARRTQWSLQTTRWEKSC